jgi:hypothetical protein
MIAVNPQGAWHRFQSSEGVTLMAATPFPSEVIELDVDDPRFFEEPRPALGPQRVSSRKKRLPRFRPVISVRPRFP